MDASLLPYKEIFINESREIISNLNQTLLRLEKSPSNSNLINDVFRCLHNIKGMSATMGFEKITKLSHELENIIDLVQKGERNLTSEMINTLFKGIDWLETLINGLGKRIESDERLTKTVKDRFELSTPLEEITKPTTLRIDIKILDELINLIGELVISKNRLQEAISSLNDNELNDLSYNVNKIISNLENAVLKTRIVPTDYIFNRFPRTVRDLAREQKKDINFIIDGKDIGLDRGILDELYEPLIHILRNAVYHGIETPEIREKEGKNPQGKIMLTARKEENHVIIEVEDDGHGININKVKEIAIKKGIIKSNEIGLLSEKECFYFLTIPGFTTVTSANQISGRGIGLDVAKTKIESLNGTFQIESTFKKGSKWTIKVPLTLAIIQALIVDVYGETYALPFSIVKKVYPVPSSGGARVDPKCELINLKKLLCIENGTKDDSKEVIVTEYKGKDIGLEISKIKSQHEIVVKPISKLLKPSKIFSGATILGNGEVVLILDINNIITKGGEQWP
ncbi:MAG: chemotaxis protein CheA [Candidatus Firestonebacteria bacterium]